jgi:UDP-glucose 4-epimerase
MLGHVRRGTAVAIWGTGETLRDYLYVDDFVEAMRRVLEAPTVGTFNLGSGIGCSLNRLRSIVEEVTGRPLNISFEPVRSVDVKGVVLDSTVFVSNYGWTPTVPLEEGVRRTWEWVRGLR